VFTVAAKRIVKRSFARTAGRFLAGNRRGGGLAILNYHSVHPDHPAATRPADFARQMDFLSRTHRVISFRDYLDVRSGASTIPEPCVIITFDDGYEDNYEYAFPVLREHGFPATIFLTTGFIDKAVDITEKPPAYYTGLRPLSWDRILEMKAYGIEFGGHTHTHPILTEIPGKDAEAEIVLCRRVLEDRLGEPPRFFAYPLGKRRTFDGEIIDSLVRNGFSLSCSASWGTDDWCGNLFALERIRVDAGDTILDFDDKLSGRWNWVRIIQDLLG
jgi:peptidoglycan/xylan/chitin deacetylase (PgdA/CDA1 family)